MNFVYVSPHFPEVHEKFCAALAEEGVQVLGIGDAPFEGLSERLRASLREYYRVESLERYEEVFRACAYFSFKYGKIDWLESNNEHWLDLDARLRADFNIATGPKTPQMRALKSKAAMHEIYRAAGIPTARQLCYRDPAEAEAFVAELGFPLIAKPEVGVGACDSFKLSSWEEWRDFAGRSLPWPYVLEEFVSGDILSYDALVGREGEILFETALEWPPSILDIVREQKDLCYHVLRELPPALGALGRRTVAAFAVENRFVHLEFFRLTQAKPGLGEVGDLVALEVNMRPAGGNTPDMYNYANDCSVYRYFAEMVVHGALRAAPGPAPYYCSYAGRRDAFRYEPSHETLLVEYAGELVQEGRNPAMSVPQMGNQYYLLRSPSYERVARFEREVLNRA